MDFRSMLQSLSQLSEATKEVKGGRVHTAEPGGYGRKDDEDEEGNKVKAKSTEKKGRGRPKKDADETGEVKKYDTKHLHNVFGGGKKPEKDIGKKSKKHSLKEFIDEVESQKTLNENDDYEISADRIAGMNKIHRDYYEKNPHFARSHEKQAVGKTIDASGKPITALATKVTPKFIKPEQVKRIPSGSFKSNVEEEGIMPMTSTSTSTAPQAGQKVIVKPGMPAGKPAATMTTQTGQQVASGPADQIKKLGDLVNTGNVTLTKPGSNQPLAEKAVSKKQQKFMGMVHAAQKGEKPASKEVGKVAKTMKKSDAKDFASTKHKGLPEKVKETKDLPGNQDKLDVAEPKGKLDAKDFKALSKKKKVDESMNIYESAVKHFVDDLIADIESAPFRSAFNIKGHTVDRAEKQILAAVQHDDKYNGLSDGAQRSLVKIALDFFRDEGELDEGIRTGNVPMGNTSTLPFGARPNIVDRPAVMRKQAGSDFPLSLGQVSDTSNTLTDPKTTTGLMRDLAKKSPFALEGKDMKDMQVESWEKELNSLLNEGITVSSSTGQQGSPDSVSINATDADAQELLAIVRQAGLGVFGGGEQPTSAYGAPMDPHGAEPEGHGVEPEMSPDVVGDGDDMLALIKKMTGIESGTDTPVAGELEVTSDYEDEEGEEDSGEQSYDDEEGSEEEPSDDAEDSGEEEEEADDEEETTEGNAFGQEVRQKKSDNIPDSQQRITTGGQNLPVKEEGGESCNECGGAMYEGHSCDTEQVEENFSNDVGGDAMADTEMMKLKALLSMGNDMHKMKHNNTVGNPTQVAFRESINDWKKLSGIK
jgi:hypothetical protein